LILYENELEMMYDTYYWAEFNIKDIKIPKLIFNEDKSGFFIPDFKIATKDLLELKQEKSSYKIYSQKQKKYIKKVINKNSALLPLPVQHQLIP
jgi:hypothetical protein